MGRFTGIRFVFQDYSSLVDNLTPSANNRYDESVKDALDQCYIPTTTASPTATSTTVTTVTTTSPSTSCTGIKYWRKSSIYVKGDQVKHKGHLWMAKWWTQNDIPGGDANAWLDEGSC